jgi:hypothetical protein
MLIAAEAISLRMIEDSFLKASEPTRATRAEK